MMVQFEHTELSVEELNDMMNTLSELESGDWVGVEDDRDDVTDWVRQVDSVESGDGRCVVNLVTNYDDADDGVTDISIQVELTENRRIAGILVSQENGDHVQALGIDGVEWGELQEVGEDGVKLGVATPTIEENQ